MDLMKKDLVMTSREVAEITGKRHDHVMRDIREELESLESEGLEGQLIFGESSYKNSQNKEQPMFIMGREGAMQIATRYSAAIRRKLIMRLEELENKIKLPQTYKEALLELIRVEEEKEQLALAVTNLKVAVADNAVSLFFTVEVTMKEIKITGTQEFFGKNIQVIEGGFSEDGATNSCSAWNAIKTH